MGEGESEEIEKDAVGNNAGGERAISKQGTM
jgi:hypothetical protein